MNEQVIFLFFLILGLGITLFLYIWKSKKEIDYKKDERWHLIQNKANSIVNYLNYIIILFLAIIGVLLTFSSAQITFTLNRVLTYCLLLFSLRNAIEFFALRYLDKEI